MSLIFGSLGYFLHPIIGNMLNKILDVYFITWILGLSIIIKTPKWWKLKFVVTILIISLFAIDFFHLTK